MNDNQNENAEVVVTKDHVASVGRALQHDVSGLTPEMVSDEAMMMAAAIIAHMDELDRLSPNSVEMMLAIVGDNYDPQIRSWAKVAFDLVDGTELRSANRQLEMAMHRVWKRYGSWEAWKREVGVTPSAAA